MRKILRIAKLELATMFYSPIAWLVLIVFIIQTGIDFTDQLRNFEVRQQMHQLLHLLTFRIFADPNFGLFTLVQNKIYLYIPLLTMGLMSRERSAGTIKLLLSSPVRLGEIIAGKYLAMMLYGLLLAGVMLIFVLCGQIAIASFDLSYALSGVIGLYLLICTYSAIGLFMSSLTSYQVVAAISTLVVFAFLSYIGDVWQNIDFVRDLTYFLSISGRSYKMITGLISTRDVFYFVIIIVMFLGFSLLKLLGEREKGGGWLKAGRYAGLVCTCLLLGYGSSRPSMTGYIDMTGNKANSLSEKSLKVIRQLRFPLEITTYVNLFDIYNYGLPSDRNPDMDRFEQYTRFLPDLTMKYVYYYDKPDAAHYEGLRNSFPGMDDSTIARKSAAANKIPFKLFHPPSEMNKIIDLAPEEHRFIRQLQAGDRKTFLRIYNDTKHLPNEEEITAAIKRLVVTPVKIGFLSGNNERTMYKAGDQDYKISTIQQDFRYSLINQGFDVVTVAPGAKIPDDIDILVIADPKWRLDPVTMTAVQAYIAKGGNGMIAGEPGKQEVVNPLLLPFGVHMAEGRLIRQSKDFAPDFILTQLGAKAGKVSDLFPELAAIESVISMPGAGTLGYSDSAGFDITPVLVANPRNTWIRTGPIDPDSSEIRYDPAAGDIKTSAPTLLSLTRQQAGKEQRFIVAADADFFSNSEATRREPYTLNFRFSLQLFSWLSNGEFPIDTRTKETEDIKLNIDKKGVVVFKIFLLGILPLLLLTAGAILLIKRRSY